jgi:uncharacterized phage protein (TIGR01671 family)
VADILSIDGEAFSARIIPPGGAFTKDGIIRHISEIELMQFTGLIDKNGREIYEGDIVFSLDKAYEVEFYEGCFGIHIPSPDRAYPHHYCQAYGKAMAEDDEVIGNIHETPELLK